MPPEGEGWPDFVGWSRFAQTAQKSPAQIMGEFVDEVSDLSVVRLKPATPDAPAKESDPIAPVAALPVPEGDGVGSGVSNPLKKPLLWTAASQLEAQRPETDQSHVPPVLRNLHKCQACGFPVSEGRKLCVECEEKQWRGQLRPAPDRG